jgi:pimeloyl-ACP methyl ester carboxylesterase
VKELSGKIRIFPAYQRSLPTRVMAQDLYFSYLDEGEGPALVFQHGLGGDMHQVSALLGGQIGRRRLLCMECLNHGETAFTSDRSCLSLPAFATDLEAFIDAQSVQGEVIGGLSMGAAIALRVAQDRPGAFPGLILLRPAWMADPAPAHLRPFLEIAEFLEAYGPWEGRELYPRSATYQEVYAVSPAAAQALLNQFETEHPLERALTLREIVNSAPLSGPEAFGSIDMPVLVMASENDPIHPRGLAEEIAGRLPQAVFRLIPSKYTDEAGYHAAVRREIADFLNRLE